jgi:Retroviral aspartyl protease
VGHYIFVEQQSQEDKRQWALRKGMLKAQKESRIEDDSKIVFIPEFGKSYKFLQWSKVPTKMIKTKKKKERKPLENWYKKEQWELEVKVKLITLDSKKEFIIMALIDSGYTHSTIDSDFVWENRLTTTPLEYPWLVRNAENKEGRVTDCLEVMMEVTGKDHQERIDFAVTKLGSHKMFLGYDWIYMHNPSIDWHSGTINFDRCPPKFNCQNSSYSMTP